MKRVLVCGGRDYKSVSRVALTLGVLIDELGEFMVIHGDAPGADRLAGAWAQASGLPEIKVPAQWEHYGQSAGPVRNGWMLLLAPDLVVAFPGGRGTANMMRQARAVGVEVREVLP